MPFAKFFSGFSVLSTRLAHRLNTAVRKNGKHHKGEHSEPGLIARVGRGNEVHLLSEMSAVQAQNGNADQQQHQVQAHRRDPTHGGNAGNFVDALRRHQRYNHHPADGQNPDHLRGSSDRPKTRPECNRCRKQTSKTVPRPWPPY